MMKHIVVACFAFSGLARRLPYESSNMGAHDMIISKEEKLQQLLLALGPLLNRQSNKLHAQSTHSMRSTVRMEEKRFDPADYIEDGEKTNPLPQILIALVAIISTYGFAKILYCLTVEKMCYL
mmetsp:Transcript_104492/g.162920  ORF Transcript_104492/g.162920 Transcript_104492/m.162920 type:complete len:123 (-) Transcript_104492:103-471(-)